MTFADWLSNARVYANNHPPQQAARLISGEFYQGIARRYGKLMQKVPYQPGTPVWEHEWDVLVVLDACRTDALREVAPEYDWLPAPEQIQTTRSLGSMSEEWMEANFGDEYAAEKRRTAHITWNAFSSHQLEPENWALLDEVWDDVWERGCVPPRAITERAVDAWRSDVADQMICHYHQPHRPYRKEIDGIERPSHEDVGKRHTQNTVVWDLLRSGELDVETAWDAYIDNLRWALDDIAVLRENLDADRVLLTADHGDCFGEFGFYGHPRGVPMAELVEVPIVGIGATDRDTLQPSEFVETEASDESASGPTAAVENRLKELGYV